MFTSNKRIARVGVVLAVAAMAGCSSTPTYPPAPTQTGSYDWNYLVGPGRWGAASLRRCSDMDTR